MESNKRRAFFSIMIMSWVFMQSMLAQTFSIVKVNSSDIIINEERAEVGMTFEAPLKFTWSNINQAVKATYDNGKKMVYFRAKQTNGNPLLIDTKGLSTRDAGIYVSNDTIFFMDDAWIYIDAKRNKDAKIRVDLKVDSVIRHSAYLELGNDNLATIDRSIYGNEPAFPVYIDIIGEDTTRNWVYPIYTNLYLYPLNEEIAD